MMKKLISVIISAAVLAAGTTAAFAGDSVKTSFPDTAGTPYEEAAAVLAEEGILNGFEDGTFRPEQSITRAQACTMVTKMLDIPAAELEAAAEEAEQAFSDIKVSDWEASYVGYCTEKNITAGYPDKTFRSDQPITLSEYATILCRAAGDSDSSLGGTWPDNYMSSAQTRGLLEGLEGYDPAEDGAKLLNRGNAAIMTANLIEAENGNGEGENSGSGTEDSDTPQSALATFSGRAFGLITETGMAVNSKNTVVGSLSFLMGDTTHELLTNESLKDHVSQYDGTELLVYLQMTNGVVKGIIPVTESVKTEDGENCIVTCIAGAEAENAGQALFSKVMLRYEDLIRFYTGTGDEQKYFYAFDGKQAIYRCIPAGGGVRYEPGVIGDIYEGCYIIAYTIGDEADGDVNVMIVIDERDVDRLLTPAAGNGPRSLKAAVKN